MIPTLADSEYISLNFNQGQKDKNKKENQRAQRKSTNQNGTHLFPSYKPKDLRSRSFLIKRCMNLWYSHKFSITSF